MDTKIKTFLFLIIIILFSNSIYAEDQFNIAFPVNVITSEAFKVTIDFQNLKEEYDIKIFITKDSREYSEIYHNEKWQSPFNYILYSFPQTSTFTVRANVPGKTKLCVRLRPSKSKDKFLEVCKPISVYLEAEFLAEEESTNNSDFIVLQKPKTKIVLNSENVQDNITKSKKYYVLIIFSSALVLILLVLIIAFLRNKI